jgi:hypothetical protein
VAGTMIKAESIKRLVIVIMKDLFLEELPKSLNQIQDWSIGWKKNKGLDHNSGQD